MLVLDIHVCVQNLKTKVINDGCVYHGNQRLDRRGDKEIQFSQSSLVHFRVLYHVYVYILFKNKV